MRPTQSQLFPAHNIRTSVPLIPYVRACSNLLRSNHEALRSWTVGKSTVEPRWTGGLTKQWPEGRERWVKRVPNPAFAMVECLLSSAFVDGGGSNASGAVEEAEVAGEAMMTLLLSVCGCGWEGRVGLRHGNEHFWQVRRRIY